MWSATRVCGFVRRHKKLVIATSVTAACAGGVYYGYKRMLQQAERFTTQLQQQMAEHQRLQLALSSTTEESRATIQRFLPRLKKTLYALIDLEKIVSELKALDKTHKAERSVLWEQAKRTAFTRYFTALIAFGLWHLLVFAQLSIIGKQTFEKHKGARTTEEEQAMVEAQHTFLASGLEYFLDHGLARIHKHVESVVVANEQLQSWDVSHKLKVEREELNQLFQSLYLSILPQEATKREENEWRSFLIYPEKQPGQTESVIELLNDLWDLLESPFFGPALEHSLGFLCGNAFQDLTDVVYGCEGASNSKPAPPLAKLIPSLQTEVSKLLKPKSQGSESYLMKYSQGIGEVETFRNFYEAVFFQQFNEDQSMI